MKKQIDESFAMTLNTLQAFPELHCQENKGKYEQDFKKRISPSEGMVRRTFLGAELFSWVCWKWLGIC